MSNVIELKSPAQLAVEAHKKAWDRPQASQTVLAQQLRDETPPPVGTLIDRMNKTAKSGDTPPSIRTVARQQGIDIRTLISILEYQRPANGTTEEVFVQTYIDPIEGMQKDGYGNYYLTIGDKPNVLWSCHTDTVAYEDGKQNVKWDGDCLVLNQPKSGQCLGADDGAGIWLLLEMIKAKVPGLYIFHREEEIGGKGSKWIAANNKELLTGIDVAIAFDRRKTGSVITHQRGGRCCSEDFGKALAEKLGQTDGLKYELDPTGSFTDTASYTDLIAECTNVSCGYYDEHSAKERLDVAHLVRLREALITHDFSDLPVKRDPTEVDDDDWYGYGYGGGYYRGNSNYRSPSRGVTTHGIGEWEKGTTPLERMQMLVKERPYTIAQMLVNMGLTASMLDEALVNVWKVAEKTGTTGSYQAHKAKMAHDQGVKDYLARTGQTDEDEPIYEDALYCNKCQDFCDPKYLYVDPNAGDPCPTCYENDTELMEVEVDAISGDYIQ